MSGSSSRPLDRTAALVALTAAVTLASVFLPWIARIDSDLRGTSFDRGIVTAVMAGELVVFALLRALGQMRRGWYVAVALPLAAIALAMPLWLHRDTIGAWDDRWLIDPPPTLHAALGLRLCIAAATASLALVLAQATAWLAELRPGTDAPELTATG